MEKLLLRGCFVALGLLCSFSGLSQVKNDFGVRYENKLKGDITLIGNNIVNSNSRHSVCVRYFWGFCIESEWIYHDPNDPYSGSTANDNLNMQYIDIDGDSSTFSSSSANLTVPDPECSRIRYAALYWGAVYPEDDRDDDGNPRFDQVKFKMPGGSYIDLTADEILFDGDGDSDFGDYAPYAAYKDVTTLVAGQADPDGEYTLANIRAGSGSFSPGGISGGWMMVVVYENPTLPGKFITTFDGYAGIKSEESAEIPFSGFTTLPAPFPVNAKIGVATLEGDRDISGDRLSIQADSNSSATYLGNTVNPSNNFFNSNITFEENTITSRNPNSPNTLGWDVDMFTIPNPGNNVIPNDETGATFYATSTQDKYDIFFTSLDVEIIEPQINLAKTVQNLSGDDITGQGVNLGQELNYVLTFKNVGNDDAIDYTIRDVLPINVTLNEDLFVLPPGVTYTYDPDTRTVLFTIPDALVEEDDPEAVIRMRVKVAENCYDFVDACTDIIQNLAFSTYRGGINPNQITDDPSVYDFSECGFPSPGATNFLLDDLSACDFVREVQLCGDNVLLTAGENFDAYVWYKDENGNGEIDLGIDTVITDADTDGDPSTMLVSEVGTYIVDKQVADPCKDFQEIITVTLFGSIQSNPITALINDPNSGVDGEILTCPNDGSELPEIFLCGLNDTQLIQMNIPDALSIVWEKLDEDSCGEGVENCANTNISCQWDTVDTGIDFTASEAGQYRLVVNYQDGCFTRFFFNVYKNELDPQQESNDIFCGNPGNITILNMPTDYLFQLVDQTTGSVLVPYGPDRSFDIANSGTYRVEMIQDGVDDGCVFVLDNIGIRERDFRVDVDSKDSDCSGLGEISISLLDVEAQYYYEISQGGTITSTHGPSADNNYTFVGLHPGVYDVRATTDDGCEYTDQITIEDVTDLAVNAITTKNIDCTDGVITVTGTGGYPNPYYNYAIWSYNGVDLYSDISDIPAEAFQTNSDFTFTNGQEGEYEFVALDGNNCPAFSNSAVIEISPAVEYTTALEDESCFGAEDGTFTITITQANGYGLYYTLTHPDTSVTYNTSGNFTELGRGDYTLTVTQDDGTNSCDFVETFTIGGPDELVADMNPVLVQDYTCLQDAIIGVQNVSGGTAPYEYSIDGVNFVPDSGTLGEEFFSDLEEGTYTITVRDANNCILAINPITIDPLDPPTDISFAATDPLCPDFESNVTLTVTGGTPDLVYEIIAPAGSVGNNGTSNVFEGLAPDTYLFRVTDSNGCSYEESFTLETVSVITVTGQSISNIGCFAASDGEASFTVSNFNTDFNYSISGPANFNGTSQTNGSIPLDGLAAGTYTITVTDNLTGCVDTADVTIESPTAALTASHVLTQPTCEAVGAVNISAQDGWGSYTYEITSGPAGYTLPPSNGNGQFGNLTLVGNYTYTVTDANGCEFIDDFDVVAAVPPVLEITANDICYDDAVGLTLTANVASGGDGNYEYSLNGGPFRDSPEFSDLGPGTYTIEVRDGNDCTDDATITIDPELSLVASAPNISSCEDETLVSITAAGGDGNYVYAIVPTGGTPNGTDFSDINPRTEDAPGTYDVYVRDNDGAAGYCEAMYTISIAQDPPVTMSVTTTDNMCSGDTQGQIVVSGSGGEGPYTYSINGGTFSPNNTFNNLAAGSYVVRVRDANNCEEQETVTITEPITLSASAAVTALAECFPGLGAEVRITNPIGGTAPYEYSFNGTTYDSNPIGNLLPGTHTVFIRDDNGCVYSMPVTVEPEPTPPTVTHTVDYDCEGNGIITLTGSSADFDYTYLLDSNPNDPIGSNVFTDVTPGNHTITVNYNSISAPSPSVLLLEDFGTGPNTSIPEIDGDYYCYEPQNGTATACAPITSPPRTTNSPNSQINDLEYSVTQVISSPFVTWLSPNDASMVPNGRFLAINVGNPGVNTVVYAKRNVEVVPNLDVEISLAVFNLLRNGESGLDPDIMVELVDSSTNTVIAYGTTGLVPKNNGVNDWFRPPSISLNPGSNTSIDIVIRTIATGDNGNDIAIDDIQALQYPEVCPGTFTLDVLIEDGHAFDAELTAHTDITCFEGNDGTISFEVENFDLGIGFTYQINGGTQSLPQINGSVIISDLVAGDYEITIVDLRDPSCSVVLNQTLTEPDELIVSAVVDPALTCNDGATITATVAGGSPTFEYQLLDADGATEVEPFQASAIFRNVAPAGDYVIRVRDANNCETTTPVTVDPPTPIFFTAVPSTCYAGANDGTITVNVTDGNGNYMFSRDGINWFTPEVSTPDEYVFENLTPGTYDIYVRDGYGCPGGPQPITIDPQLTASATLDADLICGVDASITISANGGSGTYTYEWSNNGGSNYFSTGFSGPVFMTDTAGTYQFRITDSTVPTACTVITNPIVVTPAVPPVITSVVPTDILCHGEITGALDITIDTTVGVPPYTINVSRTDVPNDYGTQTTGLPAGIYEVTVTDDKGCVSLPVTATIAEPDPITPNITQTNLTCTDTVNELGTITIDASGGSPDYVYEIFNADHSYSDDYDTSTGANEHTFVGLDFGEYTIVVTDTNGCQYITTRIITTGPDVLITTEGTAGCTPGSGTMLVEAEASNGTLGAGTFYFALYPAPSFDALDPAWFPEDTPPAPDNTHLFTGLTPGVTYTFIVYDSDTDCVYIQEATVPVYTESNLVPSIDTVTDITCTGATDGQVDITISGYDGSSVDYEVFTTVTHTAIGVTGTITGPVGGSVSEIIPGLSPGEFYILFTEEDGCVIASDPFVIQQSPRLLELTASSPENANCNEDGVITASARYGTAPYSFQYLLDTDPAPTAASAGWSSDTSVNVEHGDYIVYVKDANNCIQQTDITVALDPSPEISHAIIDECVEEGLFQVEITLDNATEAMAPFQISVNGQPFQNFSFDGSDRYIVSNLSSGIPQNIRVRDLNGCMDRVDFDIHPPLEFTAQPVVALDCEPGADGYAHIEISVDAGSGSYEYGIVDPNGTSVVAANTPFPTTAPTFIWEDAETDGVYEITVWDVANDCSVTIPVTIQPAPVPNFTETHVDVTCFGGSDGSISLQEVDNGINPLTYTLDPMPGSATWNAATKTFEGLPAGTYDVRGMGSNECEFLIEDIVITEPDEIEVPAPDVVEFGCTAGNNMNTASISIDTDLITGGSNTYTRYEFIHDIRGVVQNGSSPVYIETDTAGGNYTINVYDSNGCVGTTNATIAPFVEFDDVTTIITPVSCAYNDGSITIAVETTVLGATSIANPLDFAYSIDGGVTWQESPTYTNPNEFTGLGVGTYAFLVRNIATGCEVSVSETLVEPNTFTIDVVDVVDVSCYGTASGSVTFELLDATYTDGFNWAIYNTNGGVTPTLPAVASGSSSTIDPITQGGLEAGSYIIEISQDSFPGCVNVEAFTISGPSAALTATATSTDITCVPGNDGVIEISASGGWGGYKYYVSTTPNPDPYDEANYGTTHRIEDLPVGDYEIWVIDQMGCAIQLSNIDLDVPDPIVADLRINDDNCAAFEGEIEVVGTPETDPISGGQGSNYTYQLYRGATAIGSPQTNPVFTGLGAGSYTVHIADQWGCPAIVGPVELYDVMTATTAVASSIECDPANQNTGGAITVTVSGGSGDYVYLVELPDGTFDSNDSGVFTGLDQVGTYEFTITDTNTTSSNCEITVTQYLGAPVIPVIDNVDVVDVSCHGGSDGVLTVVMDPSSVVDRVLTYVLYQASDLVNPYRHAQNIGIFDMLPEGDYRVRVISSRGCFDTFDVTVGEPLELTATATATPFECVVNNTVNESTVTVAVGLGTGTAPYRFSFEGGGFSSNASFTVFDTGVAQPINYTVRDANGCTYSDSIVVQPLNTFDVNLVQDTAIGCSGPEVVTLSVANELIAGDSYTFELLPVGNTNGSVVGTPVTTTSASFELFYPGNYTFRITNNSTGCYELVYHEILPYDLIDVEAVATLPAVCFDSAGTMEFTVSGNVGAYSYEVFRSDGTSIGTGTGSGNGTLSFSDPNLIGGNYSVRVTQIDHPECSEDSNMITIVSPDRPLTVAPMEVANVTCSDDQGEILVTPTGGYAPYDIELTNTTTGDSQTVENVSSQLFMGLSSGDYLVRVIDAGGCEIISNLSLEMPDPIVTGINASPANLLCYGDTNGSVWADLPTGGSGSYQYRLNTYDATGSTIVTTSGAQSKPTFNGLGAGTYSITVSDGWSCDVTTPLVTITEPVEVFANLVQVTAMSCTDDAEILLTASGGTGPYSYSVDGVTYLPMAGGDTQSFDVLVGTYQYYVRDANGCDANISNQIAIDPVPDLVLAIDESAAMINCMGEATASIRATAFGGLGNYSYELYGDALFTQLLVGPQPRGTFSALAAGEYFIRVTSGDCVEESNVIVIEDPLPLEVITEDSTDVSCYGLSDGSINVEVIGGTGEILYAISPNLNQFDTENSFTGLAAGIYDIVAQDVNGCFITFQFEIGQPDPLEATADNILHEVCYESADGSFELMVSGGTAPYSTSLDSNASADFVPGQFIFQNLSAGTHVVFVRDAQGCETNLFVEIEPGVNLAATVTPMYECTGNVPDNSLDVVFEDPAVVTEVMYALDSTDPNAFQLEADFVNMTPGTHTLHVLHSNGCMVSYPFEIADYEPLELVLENNNINQITAVASGGVEEYTFYFEGVDQGSETTFYINRTDTYTVRVVDQNGCEMLAQIYVEFIDLGMPSFFTPDGDGQNDTWIPENIDGFPEVLIRIYDRYGRVVEQMTRDTQGWDGNYDGKPLPTGDYWYIVQINGANDDREWVGHFTLYRQ